MENKLLHTKEGLILTAIEVMNELGIQGLSTRVIAKRQGVSEPTIFRHFKSKNDLMLSMLDYYSKYDSDIIKSVRLKKLRPIEALIYLITIYMEYYENYPSITAITSSYEVICCDPKLESKVRGILETRAAYIKELIEDAKAAGEIVSSIDSEKLSDTVWSICIGICFKWRHNKYKFSLKEHVLATVQMILGAFMINNECSDSNT